MSRAVKRLSLLLVLPLSLMLVLIIPVPGFMAKSMTSAISTASARNMDATVSTASAIIKANDENTTSAGSIKPMTCVTPKVSTTKDKTANRSNAITVSAIDVGPANRVTKKKPAEKPTYLVRVDRNKQQMTVWETREGVKKAIRTMSCATGKRNTPTPKGVFKMKPVGKFLYDQKYHCYLKYVIRFKGGYLIHSVPLSRNGNVLDTTIGRPASHGCIRLMTEDAKWLYQLPAGTKLVVE